MMNRKSLALVTFIMVILSAALGLGGSGGSVRAGGVKIKGEYAAGQLIVRFKDGVSRSNRARVLAADGLKVLRENARLKFQVVEVATGSSVPATMAELLADPRVEYAEPNYIDRIAWTPNDPEYPNQWNMQSFDLGGMNAQAAWDVEVGNPSIIVAVVDTGVAYEDYGTYTKAPDLANTNFVSPYDAVDLDGHPNDTNGHGTHVTGTIAQSTNNALGCVGVAFGCSIMPVRSLGTGGGSHAQMADAFTWATDHGAKVINYSASGSDSTTKRNACQYAHDNGVTICAAYGNNGQQDPASYIYPAAYDDFCVCVGATDRNKAIAWYSNYGTHQDVVGPGGDTSGGEANGVIQQTYTTGDNPTSGFSYKGYQGTSMATPHVSATAALFMSRTGVTNPAAVKLQLESTARDLGDAGWDQYFGYGLVDAAAALTVPAPTIDSISPEQAMRGDHGFTLTVNGTNFVSDSAVRWNGADRATTYVSPTQLTAAIPASDIASGGTAYVAVFSPPPGGGTSNAHIFTAITPVSDQSTWYLAEGTTAWGFDTYISIMNPNDTEVVARFTYMPTGSANMAQNVMLAANSQTTIYPRDIIGENDFSTKVEAIDKTKAIAVDRTMTWNGPGAASPEGHSSVGLNFPANTWYLPEGSTNWGFETWLLVQNPNGNKADCTITYMIEGELPREFRKEVPANSRESFNMRSDIGSKDASIKLTSNVPVVPERAMYRNNRREGHDSIGTSAPAQDYYLAEGTSAWGFITYVLVQNPSGSPADVTITYMTEDGPHPQAPFTMPANSRKTVRVNDILPDTDFSTQVHGSQPIIAERAIYWNAGKGEACHDSIGMSAPHTTFYLPDGQTSEGRETWTLVQNPNGTPIQVTISYLTPTGVGNVSFTETVPANSRKTYNMADKGVNGRAAILVQSAQGGSPIMCERAMYWNSRGAGTNATGGFGD